MATTILPNPLWNWANQSAAATVMRSSGLPVTWSGGIELVCADHRNLDRYKRVRRTGRSIGQFQLHCSRERRTVHGAVLCAVSRQNAMRDSFTITDPDVSSRTR
jgi:hypothetical protein